MQDPLRPPRLTKLMLEKATLNFQDYALRAVETAVRKGFRLGQKMSFCSLNSSFTRMSISIMYKYNGLELCRIKLLITKLSDRCFCYLTAAMLVPLYKSLYIINISPNKAGMKNHTVLNLSEVVSISIIYHISDS